MPEIFDLVFRGGGIKGCAFIGALERLTAEKHVSRRMIGTSAGAIFAAAWASGYTPSEIEKVATERVEGKLPFASFVEEPRQPEWLPGFIWAPTSRIVDSAVKGALKHFKGDGEAASFWGPKTLAIALDGAGCDDAPFRSWFGKILKAKDIDPTTTLEDYHRIINKVRPQQLSLVAADITTQQALILNERTAPKLPIIEAVRMSMSIPFVWKEIVWKKAWGTYRGQDVVGHQIVDGGLLSNFPIRFFLDPFFSTEEGELGPAPKVNGTPRTLGFLLDNTKTPPDLPQAAEEVYLAEALPAVKLASRLIDTMMDANDKHTLRQYIPVNKEATTICRIGTRGFGALEFDMADDRLKALINSGRCGMDEVLKALKM